MLRKSTALLVSTCLATSMILSGCATDGLVKTDTDNNWASSCEQSADAALACVQSQMATYSSTAIKYSNESAGWGYAFTILAVGAVGFGAFDASIAALKAIGLAAGTATALNSDRAPTTVSQYYGDGAAALACVYENGSQMKSSKAASASVIGSDVANGDANLVAAELLIASPPTPAPSDKDIAALNAAIDAYSAARKIEVGVTPIIKNPGEYLMARALDVRLRLLAKLTGTPTSISDQQKIIQSYVDSANAQTVKTGAQNVPVNAAAPAVAGSSGTSAPTAASLAAQLKQNTQQLLDDIAPFSNAQSNIPNCLTSIPS